MSISEKIKRSMVTITEERYRFQVAEIERLREELKFTDEVRQSALQSLFAAEKEIERLREALQLIADPLRGPDVTHYLVAAGYQDIARKALEGK